MHSKPSMTADDRVARTRTPRATASMLALVMLLGACTAPAAEPLEPATPTGGSDVQAPVGDVDPQPEPDVPDDDEAAGLGEEELAATWAAFHTAWVDQAGAEVPDPAAFDALVTDPDATVELLEALRAGARLITTATELWPRFDIDDDNAEVTDCVIVVQHPLDTPDQAATVTISWEATAVVTDDGWRIDTARPGGLFCIAQELDDQLVSAYTSWLDGHRDWYQPPDPDHPMLATTMDEPGLSDMRAVLADDRDAGISMRFPHDTQAVVSDLGLGTARVTDCYLAPEGYGAFDAQSGERRSDVVPAPAPGQFNRTVADLERTADGWRVIGWRWEEQNTCEPGETRYVPR